MAITEVTVEHRNTYVSVSWDWASGVAPSACTYQLQRSGSEQFVANNYVVLSKGSTATSYDDYEVPTNDIWRRWHYRVVTSVTGGGEYLSDVATYYSGLKDRIVQDIRYRLSVALSAVMGIPAAIYIKKTYGDRCIDCWDQILQRCTDDKCLTCYGTGIVGGYYEPIYEWIQFQPRDDTPSIDQQGIDQKNVIGAYLGYHPYLVYGDLVVDNDFNVYIVIRNQSTYKSGAVAHQLVSLRLLQKDCVEYNLIPRSLTLPLSADPYIPLTR